MLRSKLVGNVLLKLNHDQVVVDGEPAVELIPIDRMLPCWYSGFYRNDFCMLICTCNEVNEFVKGYDIGLKVEASQQEKYEN